MKEETKSDDLERDPAEPGLRILAEMLEEASQVREDGRTGDPAREGELAPRRPK